MSHKSEHALNVIGKCVGPKGRWPLRQIFVYHPRPELYILFEMTRSRYSAVFLSVHSINDRLVSLSVLVKC